MSYDMSTWLHPRAFLIAAVLMAIVQLGKFQNTEITPIAIFSAVIACLLGGVFWGAIGTYFYKRFPVASSRKKIIIILILGAVFLIPIGIEIVGWHGNGAEESMSAREVTEMLDLLSSDKIITQSTAPKDNASFSVFIKYYLSRLQQVNNELVNEINKFGLWDMISPENLTNIQLAKQSREEATELEQHVSDYEKRSLNEYDQLGIELSKRKDRSSQDFYKGYKDMKHYNIQILKQRYEIHKNRISTIGQILDLAISRSGKFHLTDSQLMFEEQETLDLYNSYIKRLTSLDQQEESLARREQQRLEDTKTEINSQL